MTPSISAGVPCREGVWCWGRGLGTDRVGGLNRSTVKVQGL